MGMIITEGIPVIEEQKEHWDSRNRRSTGNWENSWKSKNRENTRKRGNRGNTEGNWEW